MMVADTQTDLLLNLLLARQQLRHTSNRPLTWLNRKLGGLNGYCDGNVIRP